MAHRIGRRIYTTHCNCTICDSDNNLTTTEIDIVGAPRNEKRLLAMVRKALGVENVMVNTTSEASKFYSMSVENFINAADKVTD